MEEGRQRGMGEGEGRKLYVRKRTSSGLKRERGEGSRDESTKYAESTYSVPSPGLGVDTHMVHFSSSQPRECYFTDGERGY